MSETRDKPVVLVLLDGWDTSSLPGGSAKPFTPNYDAIKQNFPSTRLEAMENGEPFGAEAGHKQIGAGRPVASDAARVREAIATGEFFENKALTDAFEGAASGSGDLHLIGLLSDGGVHSSQETLFALLRMAKRSGVREAYVHCILDGRDVPNRTADVYVEALEIKMADIGIGKIASLCGRFFAMDSDENWERTARVFTMLVLAEGERAPDARSAVRASFLRGLADEFVAPIVIEDTPDQPRATIKNGDTVIFFNHRADTMRQLVRSLAVTDGSAAKPVINAVCLTEYDRAFALPTAFPPLPAIATVASALEDAGINNYRISDGERADHVTEFFNGTAHAELVHERKLIVPKVNVSTYAAEPEMMSFKIADKLLRAMETDTSAVFVVNLPAAELIAEAGSETAAIEAFQFVDTCLGEIIEKVQDLNGTAIVTSSHAVSGFVPFHLVGPDSGAMRVRGDASLSDVGPTLLGLAGVDVPGEMTGRDIRVV